MVDANSLILTAYSTDFRWTGEVSIPAQRRLSDFVNDERTAALVFKHATPATWENNLFTELPITESIVLPKRNFLFVVSKSDPSLPDGSKFERVPKEPFQVIMYMPPYTLAGRISLPPHADWINMASTASENFFPVTEVSVWHIKTRSKLETGTRLVLVNWKWLLGLEPQR